MTRNFASPCICCRSKEAQTDWELPWAFSYDTSAMLFMQDHPWSMTFPFQPLSTCEIDELHSPCSPESDVAMVVIANSYQQRSRILRRIHQESLEHSTSNQSSSEQSLCTRYHCGSSTPTRGFDDMGYVRSQGDWVHSHRTMLESSMPALRLLDITDHRISRCILK